MYNVKSVQIKVEDVDVEKGIIKVMPAAFGNIDSDNEMITRGAFKKTIQERGPESDKNRIKHLWQHDIWQPIGKPIEITETSKGLTVLTKFGSDQFSQDKLKQHIDEIITEMSIGFQVINSKREGTGEEENEYTKLTELKLWEYSSVTWGSNYLTRAKSEFSPDLLETVNKRMNKLVKALHSGSYTDETFENFQIELKQIQEFYNSLIESPHSTQDDKSIAIIKGFINEFKQ